LIIWLFDYLFNVYAVVCLKHCRHCEARNPKGSAKPTNPRNEEALNKGIATSHCSYLAALLAMTETPQTPKGALREYYLERLTALTDEAGKSPLFVLLYYMNNKVLMLSASPQVGDLGAENKQWIASFLAMTKCKVQTSILNSNV